jgi:hypothetical protein
MLNKQETAHLAIDTAIRERIPPALVCAIIEVSSQWNVALQEWEPEPWLVNSHPNDFPGGETEYLALGTRWGLMQFMGSRAKQSGYKGKLSWELLEPRQNIEAGCCILRNILGSRPDHPRSILMPWYGIERRAMVGPTLAVLPRMTEFVAARPEIVSAG